MSIHIASRRRKLANVEGEHPGAAIIDVTSKADTSNCASAEGRVDSADNQSHHSKYVFPTMMDSIRIERNQWHPLSTSAP